MHRWCIADALLVHCWCIAGASLVHCWCIAGALQIGDTFYGHARMDTAHSPGCRPASFTCSTPQPQLSPGHSHTTHSAATATLGMHTWMIFNLYGIGNAASYRWIANFYKLKYNEDALLTLVSVTGSG